MRTILSVERCPVYLNDDTSVEFTAYGRIDDDGPGSSHGDRCHQSQTSLRHNGQYLDADKHRYIVLPPQIIRAVPGIVLGCQVEVSYRGITKTAVVGDVGPGDRLGEISEALAIALGINPSPISGGVDQPQVHYHVHPGVPAVVDGVTYQLQRS